MPSRNIIALLTDFGLADAYVGIMKGVMLDINPTAYFVDISHQVPPQDVRTAAFLLGTAYPYFPKDTVYLVIVDPGVGGPRRAVALATPKAFFVAPDNGVLSYVLSSEQQEIPSTGVPTTEDPFTTMVEVPLTPPLRAVHLTDPRWWRPEISATFHGRDIFAPVAAHISRGVPLEEIGMPIDRLLAFPIPRPRRMPDGTLEGRIIHIDRFGNLITNIMRADLPEGPVVVVLGRQSVVGLSRSYADGQELVALIGSAGHLEIAVPNGSAADRLGARVGDIVRVVRGLPNRVVL